MDPKLWSKGFQNEASSYLGCIKSIFLPRGFPQSVSKDYVAYQVNFWNKCSETSVFKHFSSIFFNLWKQILQISLSLMISNSLVRFPRFMPRFYSFGIRFKRCARLLLVHSQQMQFSKESAQETKTRRHLQLQPTGS